MQLPEQLMADMAAGKTFNDFDPRLQARRGEVAALAERYTACQKSGDNAGMTAILKELLGHCGPGAFILPPFSVQLGSFISLGKDSFINQGSIRCV